MSFEICRMLRCHKIRYSIQTAQFLLGQTSRGWKWDGEERMIEIQKKRKRALIRRWDMREWGKEGGSWRIRGMSGMEREIGEIVEGLIGTTDRWWWERRENEERPEKERRDHIHLTWGAHYTHNNKWLRHPILLLLRLCTSLPSPSLVAL